MRHSFLSAPTARCESTWISCAHPSGSHLHSPRFVNGNGADIGTLVGSILWRRALNAENTIVSWGRGRRADAVCAAHARLPVSGWLVGARCQRPTPALGLGSACTEHLERPESQLSRPLTPCSTSTPSTPPVKTHSSRCPLYTVRD